jgi:cell wall-associated NlpC family hydrolase
MLRAAPDGHARATSQLMLGEGFEALEIAGEWVWGQCTHDGYVGYLPVADFGPPRPATHRVTAVTAPIFATPDIKAPVIGALPIGARVQAHPEGDFLAVEQGFLHQRHLRMLGEIVADPVAVAERLIGQPYLWGGRGAGGIDCSGLVQLALGCAGVAAPRDSDLQRDTLGEEIPEEARIRRGDLIFFPGHVGLMVDEERLIHATAHWMAVTVEPLGDVVSRLAPAHPQPVLARKRLVLS